MAIVLKTMAWFAWVEIPLSTKYAFTFCFISEANSACILLLNFILEGALLTINPNVWEYKCKLEDWKENFKKRFKN